MSRLPPLVFAALLPAAIAAPVPRDVRPEFGSNGLLSRADLEKVRFDSRPVPDRDRRERRREVDEPKEVEKPGAAPRPANRYDVAVHMPWAAFREAEPIPAYLVLRNNRPAVLGLHSRPDFSEPYPMFHGGGCGFDVRDRATGESVLEGISHATNCGGGSLVDVPGDGYYVARADLARVAGKPLRPGEYEVDWSYDRFRSAPVRFTVTRSDLPARPAARPVTSHYFRLSPAGDGDERPGAAGRPVVWREVGLEQVYAGDVAAALGVGHAGVYAPDVRAIPSADGVVEAALEWRPYREGDRAVVTLRAGPKFERVRFAALPELHLQLDVPGEDRVAVALEKQQKALGQLGAEEWVTPLTVEARLPAGWREACEVEGTGRLSVLVTSGRLELPTGMREKVKVAEDRIDPAGRARPPVWSGVVRTAAVEVRFPPAGP
ncbi:MAG: hypothetical protein C0501_10425 [Isosphaera sp.]|nr:hypothetical protein [Isosphaera sp.]